MLDGENSQVFFLTGFQHAELEFSKTRLEFFVGSMTIPGGKKQNYKYGDLQVPPMKRRIHHQGIYVETISYKSLD